MVVVGKWEVTVTTLCTPRVSNMCSSCFPTNSWPPLSFSFILLLVSLPHKLTLLILHPPGHFCPSLHLVCSHKGCECPGGQSSSLYLPVWLNPISLGFLQHRSPITSQSFLDTFSSAFFIFSLKDVKTVLSCYLLKWLDCFLQLLTSLLKLCPTWWSLPHFFPAFLLERINVIIFRLLLTLCLFPNVFHNTDFCLDTACESIPGQFFFWLGLTWIYHTTQLKLPLLRSALSETPFLILTCPISYRVHSAPQPLWHLCKLLISTQGMQPK